MSVPPSVAHQNLSIATRLVNGWQLVDVVFRRLVHADQFDLRAPSRRNSESAYPKRPGPKLNVPESAPRLTSIHRRFSSGPLGNRTHP